MCLTPIFVKGVGNVPCRKCVECKQQFSNEWAYRVMLEARKHKENCFITLTYNDANLPKEGVCKRSAQLFMKRLRKAIAPIKVRYFLCGEYGSKKNRPHYHIILFGYDFSDKYYFTTDKRGNPIYRSPLLEKCWTFGFSSVGEKLDFESAKYCAKYMQADYREFEKLGLNAPFTLVSRRPGLALDVIPDTVYQTGDFYYDGRKVPTPRAFLKQVKKEFPEMYSAIQYRHLPLSKKFELKYLDGKAPLIDFETGEVLKPKHFFVDVPLDNGCDGEVHWTNPAFELWSLLVQDEKLNDYLRREERKKKFRRIFGNTLDKCFRPVLLSKRRCSMRKT